MKEKTRYLQVSDTMMFEYTLMNDADPNVNYPHVGTIYCTKLKDNRLALVSPVNCECELDENGHYKKKISPETLNTINHLSIPKDSADSMWYYFNDADYEYVDALLMNDNIDENQVKVREYCKYLSAPDSSCSGMFRTFSNAGSQFSIRYDRVRLYFVNGYDFSNVYGIYTRVSAVRKKDTAEVADKMVDFCNFFFTKENAYKMMNYLPSPILLGNDIYDRYIEISVPCWKDLYDNRDIVNTDPDYNPYLPNYLYLDDAYSLRVSFAIVLDDDVTIVPIEYDIPIIINNADVTGDYVNVSYARSSTLKGVIPHDNMNSDNLGCYIAEVPGKPYIQFYATWRDKPLTSSTVWRFNKGIRLYDTSHIIRPNGGYEIDDDYEVEHDERKWMAMHEIKMSFLRNSTVIKEETYSMNQIFISENDPSVFYYRPIIFDESNGIFVDNINIVYTMRFVNSNDKVQFVKVASLSITGNMGKYYAMGTNLSVTDMSPYRVYNKIVENNGTVINNNGSPIQTTKYVKVYYNSTDVVMTDNGGNLVSSFDYNLNMSQAPKTYKFVFKTKKVDGRYTFVDFSDGYYKLMFKDSGGNTVLVEPTYSTNMNPILGELEFNITNAHIKKITNVEGDKRKMSVVSYGEDGTVSSLFDFTYTI